MNQTTALLTVALLTALPLFAQEKAPKKDPAPTAAEPAKTIAPPPPASAEKDPDRLELMPTKPAQLLPPPLGGLSLIPEIPMPPDRSRPRTGESPIKKRDTTTADAEDLVRQRIRMREARTKAQRDPAVQAEWDRATAVKTDYEKREAMKSYYRMLYGRMARIDASLKTPIDQQLQESLARLEQRHLAPTQPPATAADGPRAKR